MSEYNGVILQHFHWYNPPDGNLWNDAAHNATDLAAAGITAVWLPPAFKGFSGDRDTGYGAYDLYDLGEFDQKGSVRTKYGTREQYLAAIGTLQRAGLEVYADIVLNHRIGGDLPETVIATPYAQDNRLSPTGQPREIRAYTHFTFPGRQGRYSDFQWHWHHFDAVDYDEISREPNTVFLFEGKRFDDEVALERGNYAYLMGCDLDFGCYEVQKELTDWGRWYLDTTGVNGFRLDAVKHISAWYFPIWIRRMEQHAGRHLFVVGEYWSPAVESLEWYLAEVGKSMSIFDVTLHYSLHRASLERDRFDLRHILDNSLVSRRPLQTVTFVDNHDSQPLQALESPVASWFKSHAYALILLRRDGYPCVFYPDYYGASYEDRGRDGQLHQINLPSHRAILDLLLRVRQNHAWGPQIDYFDHPNCVGWTRLGNESHPRGLAVLMSNAGEGRKWMDTGRPGARFVDLTGGIQTPVITNQDGWGEFRCPGASISVWVE